MFLGNTERPHTLIIGYGNLASAPTTAGPYIATQLAQLLTNTNVQVITQHQLTPELADTLQHAHHALFIDASLQLKPGKIRITPLQPSTTTQKLTHHVSPQSLLWL